LAGDRPGVEGAGRDGSGGVPSASGIGDVEPNGAEPALICDCGAESDDETGWERGDGGLPDRCPECRVLDPEGGATTAGIDDGVLRALGAMKAEAERELEDGEEGGE